MPNVTCFSEVVEVLDLTHDVKEISLRLIEPNKVGFKAGQYIAIEITEIKDGQPRQNNRPYSIVSPPEESKVIKLCVNLVSGGPGSTYLHALKIGDKVPFLYPFGYFIVKNNKTTPLLFVATGTGIAPMHSMIVDLIKRGSKRQMKLYWGLRNERDLYYQERFTELSQKHSFFEYVLTLSQASPEWKGRRGRVTDHIPMEVDSVEDLEAYLCGNGKMILEIRAMLMEKGMSKKSIHFEKYF